ncbi:xeroderma pigmentosum group B protein (XP-B) [Staphylotrichum tortipilum]|uniref:DNA 3'-5' helicase n=1 Tax=Staphylotrichum tortipilum TaxID=2831512 RepID=A0AAN6MJA2_9PEZI|nr:xeroderma pigmentosum group B protein (XP-B) [Staphylotrichum longicolle]
MVPKRKADSPIDEGRDGEEDVGEEADGFSKLVAQTAKKFDMSDFPYTLRPGIRDTASALFQPAQDFTALPLKPDHTNRPLWVDGCGKIILENFHRHAPRVRDFLITIAEPTARPASIYEYKLTIHSLYAGVSAGLTPADMVAMLQRFSKTRLPPNVVAFIKQCGGSYGKVKFVLRNNQHFLETTDKDVFQVLLRDPEVNLCRVEGAEESQEKAPTAAGLTIAGTKDAAGLREVEGLNRGRVPRHTQDELHSLLNEDEDTDLGPVTRAIQIKEDKVSAVAQRCLALQYPALEEYDFRNDHANPDLDIDLRPGTQIRPYQEQGLAKMFGNGRAKSGIIVLPCGAGKTLVGITAACTIKKGVVVLATGNMAAVQWRDEFLKWTNIPPSSIALFTSDHKTPFTSATGIIVTTYAMLTTTRARTSTTTPSSSQTLSFLRSREWGPLLLDEVHVAPAHTFRTVLTTLKSHAKLCLTATLLREDSKIPDLAYLIGPKLYEADWLALSTQGYLARVQCVQVWCPLPPSFQHAHLHTLAARHHPLLTALNPAKLRTCAFLIDRHAARDDKLLVLSDSLPALAAILARFRTDPACHTLLLSKVGDTSLDLPEATVLIQISSQFGSRRQEAQRLGRVLRARRRAEEEFTAFFYALVAPGTREMVFAGRRGAFLVGLGYAFKVVTRIGEMEGVGGMGFEEGELLGRVMEEIKASPHREAEARTNGNSSTGSVRSLPLRKRAKRNSQSCRHVTSGYSRLMSD